MTATTIEYEPKHAKIPEFDKLTGHDACDHCGYSKSTESASTDVPLIAQARVRVYKDDLTLTLCSHHFGDHETALITSGWAIFEDAREGLNVKIESGFA